MHGNTSNDAHLFGDSFVLLTGIILFCQGLCVAFRKIDIMHPSDTEQQPRYNQPVCRKSLQQSLKGQKEALAIFRGK